MKREFAFDEVCATASCIPHSFPAMTHLLHRLPSLILFRMCSKHSGSLSACPSAQVLRLWEAMWAAPPRHFHMWMVLAVLQHHRKPLMEAATDYDGLLKFCIQVPLPSSAPSMQ